MRGFSLVELPVHASAVLLVVQDAQDVNGFVDAADLGQGLVDAVLPRVGAEAQRYRARMEATRRTTSSQAGVIQWILMVPVRIGVSLGRGRYSKADR